LTVRRLHSLAAGALLAASLAVSLAGCASLVPPQTAALRAHAPADVPARAELADTPFYAQTEFQCGPAALATALAAAGLRADPEALAAEVFLPARQGTLQTEMLSGARRQGALAVLLPGELEALLREVAAGRPVVVLLNLGLSFAPRWHYAVVVGYALGESEMVLRSGTTQRAVMAMRTFEHTWARSGHWAFVTVAPGVLPLTASEAAVTQALLGFERVAPPAQALRAYEAAAARWPASLTLAIGRGNALAASGAKAQALAVFAAAAREHRSAAAWVNLGTVALELGRIGEARAAAREALAIDDGFAAAARELASRAAAAQ
jgi:tetratricopeptide (TPR) repeat protein